MINLNDVLFRVASRINAVIANLDAGDEPNEAEREYAQGLIQGNLAYSSVFGALPEGHPFFDLEVDDDFEQMAADRLYAQIETANELEAISSGFVEA